MIDKQGFFYLNNPELCTTLKQQGRAVRLTLQRRALTVGDRGNSFGNFELQSKMVKIIQQIRVINYQYASLSSLNGLTLQAV